MAAAEWTQRQGMDDDEFLRRCAPLANELSKEVALASRRAIASLATVPSETILPGNSFAEDLSALPYWDSLDWLGYHFETERQLQERVRLSSEIMDDGIRAAGGYRSLTVRDLVRATAAAAYLEQGS